MVLKVRMFPGLDAFDSGESGIHRVIQAYHKYLPNYGVEYVDKDATTYDLTASHASARPGADVCHVHGLYWTADYAAARWEHRANSDVIASVRSAKEVTVPSEWVEETFQRDMRFSPHVVPHGIDWDEWQGRSEYGTYVLWNKNRAADVCDPIFVGKLALAFPNVQFVSTFGPDKMPALDNLDVIGLKPHDEMKKLVMGAGIYLGTTKETFGIGVLEAMAAGVPILGFAHGGNNMLVQHGVNGYLAEPGNFSDLCAGLLYCAKYRRTLGENGRELAKRWTWEAACEKVASVYNLAMRDEPPTVSIVIPSYNYGTEAQVGRAVTSACNQTDPRVSEIIVVDDGSDDNGATEQLVGALHEADRRVRYIRQSNRGVADARNTGIRASKGKYVVCLDADDAIEPEFVGVCIEELEKDRSLGIAFTGLRYIKPTGETGVSGWPDGYDFDGFLQRRNQIPTCCTFRKEMWERLGGYKKRYCPHGAGSEDAEFWMRSGAYGWNARQVTKSGLFVYSWLSGRVSGNKAYNEPDWHTFHPWTKDEQHPFASMAKPKNGFAHPVRQYDEPIVSVVIPVGKGHEESVRDSLDSLEAQTFRKWEAIVVWDSDDVSQVDELKKAYPYARFIFRYSEDEPVKRGAGAARNIGANFSRGKLLLFLDADDWLYPEAIEKMYAAHIASGEIIYSDYVGKAFMGREDALRLGDRLLYYDDEHGEAVVRHNSFNYDCEKAIAQPGKDFYIWCLISALFPKKWHDDIDGFDENMPSWEDWDYWIRMARAGKCFSRIPEPLVVYRFYTGNRRETGRKESKNLVEYLRQKLEGTTAMACSCKGSTMTPVAATQSRSMQATTMVASDEDYVLALYTNPNRGQHKVYGGSTGSYYGYRGGGQQFYVHKMDIKVQPHLFQAIPVKPVEEELPQEPLPEPEPIIEPEKEEELPPPSAIFAESEPVSVEEQPEPAKAQPPETAKSFNIYAVPGVSDSIASQMLARGLDTPEAIIGFGSAQLITLKGIGLSRANAIIAYLKATYVDQDGEE